ncbi:hypothetical protein DY102_07220 [Apilactobacillus timberlakei]|uniref:siphovirus Gp157 family protein n=1 Tax=Apilactobacillus timberlakei TaxID=2008380 RepID=UPI00112D3316|nr:siphovirus Gp157 family protein [Apilactobacillus timberlakei]TPR21474.1 hypothetical protein DY102_07220 [Apilactobacillus timberlakei]
MTKLYELEDQYQKIASMIDGDDPQLLKDTLDSIDFEQDFNKKIGNYGKVVTNVKSDISQIDDEIKRLNNHKKTLKNNLNYLQDSMFNAMKLVDIKKVKTATNTISLRNSKRLEVKDDSLIDQEFKDIVPDKINKTRIREAIKNGQTVPGAELVAHQTLSIR